MNRTRSCTLILLWIGLLLPGCTQRTREHATEAAPETALETEPEPDPFAALEAAYSAHSPEQLTAFFERWHRSIPADELDSITDPVEREIYEIYLAFFKPAGTWGKEHDKPYAIIQESLEHAPLSGGMEGGRTIEPFRPPLSMPGVKAVYLTPAYAKALLRFLGTEQAPMGTGNIMAPARARGESENRMNFLRHCTEIIPGHWSGWHIKTHPEVQGIRLDEARGVADIYYRIGYMGGTARYEKEGATWKYKETTGSWIE